MDTEAIYKMPSVNCETAYQAICRVPLTTVHQDIKGMSDLTVKIILDILNGEKPKKREFVFEPALVKRQSA